MIFFAERRLFALFVSLFSAERTFSFFQFLCVAVDIRGVKSDP